MESKLGTAWAQITDLFKSLKKERWIDDQNEIEEIWQIVAALLKQADFGKEPWELKEKILRKIYDNDYYDHYGVYDPMHDLAKAMCCSEEENLKRAGIMMDTGTYYYGAEAARLYRELGREDLCIAFFEENLSTDCEPYLILIDCYRHRDREKAVEIASLGIRKCRRELTPFFIFLPEDAKERGDEEAFKKLMQRARRKNGVRIPEAEARFS